MDKVKPTIFLYTDGASSGNPGPGGYGVVLKCGRLEKEMSGGFARTTNNRMELLAVIVGLEAIKWQDAVVEVYSDSSYVGTSNIVNNCRIPCTDFEIRDLVSRFVKIRR